MNLKEQEKLYIKYNEELKQLDKMLKEIDLKYLKVKEKLKNAKKGKIG